MRRIYATYGLTNSFQFEVSDVSFVETVQHVFDPQFFALDHHVGTLVLPAVR